MKALLDLPDLLLSTVPEDSVVPGTPDDETIAQLAHGAFHELDLDEDAVAALEVRRLRDQVENFLATAPMFYPPRRWA